MDTSSAHASIARRLPFFGIGEKDYARFPRIARSIRRFAPKALKGLYDKIAVTPEVSNQFASRGHMDIARDKQLQHWQQLFSGRVDAGYYAKAEIIGNIHARIGLEPTWYIGGYAMVLEEVVAKTVNTSPAGLLDGGRTGRAVGTLVKAALLDMDIALSAYFKAEEAKRLKVIDQLAHALSSVAAGDFTSKLEGLPAEYAQIESDFENMRARISGALAEVADTARTINTGSSEIRQASDDLANRTEQQAASLEETAAAMNQLTAGVRELADGAGHVRQSVAQTQGEAVEGGAVVKEAVAAMDDIERSAQEIGKIINVIDGIAFQTNLLALNAGVEAARAGDAGKGFAVVANEVRALAQRSAEAANDIKALIKSSAEQVERGVALVGRSGEAFERIVTKVGEVAGLATTISELSATQSVSLGQVNGAVRDMDQMTQQNAAMVEQSTAASRSLAGEASRLAELVSRFQLGLARSASTATVQAMPTRRKPAARSAPRTAGALALKPQAHHDENEWSEF